MEIGLNEIALRSALGEFATGVCVVATRKAAGHVLAITINSFVSVSLQPPLLAWFLDDASMSGQPFLEAEHFTLNILHASQEAIARDFARSSGPACSAGLFDMAHDSYPRLSGANAVFHCHTLDRQKIGDHWMLIGRIIDFHVAPRDGAGPAALGFWRSVFRSFA